MFEGLGWPELRAGPRFLRSTGYRDGFIVSATPGANGLTPGILPSALRASFAVRAAPAAQWLLPTIRLERIEPPQAPSRSEGEAHGWAEGQEKVTRARSA